MLGLVGLRPITIDASDWTACFSHLQTFLIIVMLTAGYFMQYLSGFRWVSSLRTKNDEKNKFNFKFLFCIWFSRDRGFTNTTYPHPLPLLFNSTQEKTVYYGESIFVYGISSVLHFSAFLTAIYVFRIAESEQLQSLVERVFILCNIPNKIFYILWFHILCGFLWLITMTTYIVVMEQDQFDVIKVTWFGNPTFIVQEVAKVGRHMPMLIPKNQ